MNQTQRIDISPAGQESARRELDEQLRHAQKLESVGQLALGVAHDFNNLLTVIIGSCELLQLNESRAASDVRSIQDIDHAARRAVWLTRQLLDYGRTQSPEPKAIDLNAVIDSIRPLLLRLIGKNIELHCLLSPAIWPVRIDPGQVEQVVVNLVVNARDALAGGRGRLAIETANVVRSEQDCRPIPDCEPGRYVKLAVTDNGGGMRPEVKARIFEPFFTTKHSGQGTGLGLSIVQGIVAECGGHIDVISEVGAGTSVALYYPAV